MWIVSSFVSMKIHLLLIVIQFAFVWSQSVDVTCTFVLLDTYKCLAHGVDVRSDQISIRTINGEHDSWKTNFDVSRLEYVSVWSTFLPNGFSNFFPILRHMEVHDTPISALHRRNFVGLSHLISLSFENTKISEIPDDAFEDLLKLQELTLRKSFLKSLQPNVFNSLNNLRLFDVRDNMIGHLSRELFTENKNLESIYMSGNPLQDIQMNFTRFKNIAEVYMFNCRCINSYFVKKSSTVSLAHLQDLIQKNCHSNSLL